MSSTMWALYLGGCAITWWRIALMLYREDGESAIMAVLFAQVGCWFWPLIVPLKLAANILTWYDDHVPYNGPRAKLCLRCEQHATHGDICGWCRSEIAAHE